MIRLKNWMAGKVGFAQTYVDGELQKYPEFNQLQSACGKMQNVDLWTVYEKCAEGARSLTEVKKLGGIHNFSWGKTLLSCII